MAYRRTRTRTRRVSNRRPSTRRYTSRRAANGGNQWSRQDIAFMRKYYRKFPTAWVARQLGRTVYSVRYKASDLNIKKAKPSVWKDNPTPKSFKVGNRRTKKSRYNTPKRSIRRTTRRHTTRRANPRRTTRRIARRRIR
jgi:hypothetical protein